MNFTKTTLPNGLRIILAPMQGTETVTVLVSAGVGSRYEKDEEAGLSHFIEHMLFKGTEKRPNNEVIYEELDAIGGEFNAYTSKTQTAYYAKADYNHFEKILDVITDLYLNSKISSKEINRERGTILQEISMYEDIPMDMVGIIFDEMLYPENYLGRNIAGTKEMIQNFQRKDFLQFVKRFYVAKNTVICVAGKFDEKLVLEKVKQTFSKIQEKELENFVPVTENQISPAIKIKEKKTDQTNFVLGVRAYNMFHPDRYALKLLATILGGNMSSRIFSNVREKLGLAYYVHTGTEIFQDVGYLYTQAGVEHKNLNKAVEMILKDYKKIAKKKVDEKELQKAKDYLKGKTIMSLESSSSVANFLLNQEIDRGEILIPHQIFAKLDKVTTDDILRVAKDIFVSSKLNLAIIGPQKENEKEIEKILNL